MPMTRLLTSCALTATIALSACRGTPAPAASGAAASQPVTVALQHFEFGGDFTLTNAALRAPTHLTDLRGSVVLLFFGYTACPDACPLTMSKITRAIELTPGAREAVKTVFVTVDVERDGPETLARYASSFGVPMIGLTGTRQQVDGVVAQYKASYSITPSDSAGGPTVSHTVYTYLIDRQGELRYIFRHEDSPDTIAAGLAEAMKAQAGD